MTTSNDIANRAIQLIGDNQPAITGNAPSFDGSTAGVACAKLYAGVVATVGRQFGWDFARNNAVLQQTGNAAPFPWAFEYTYPASGIQVRQITPPNLGDANDPLPINWTVGNASVGGAPTKVIWTNQASALAVISSQPNENLWDALFTEEVVRLLASELAMALAGKPDTAKDAFEQSAQFGQLGETRDS